MLKQKQAEEKYREMNKFSYFLLSLALIFLNSLCFAQQTGKLMVSFNQEANGREIVVRDSTYSNPFGETYTIKKLKYYTGQWNFNNRIIDLYTLINAASEENHVEFDLPPGKYREFSFLLGVDSASNCSGAQEGALDPMNDMFWTWNSGYIMFKLEGNSQESTADLNRIEWHIGGYKGPLNATRRITFNEPFEIIAGKTTQMEIVLNLDKVWDGKNKIKISEDPMCMTMGALAQKIADNFQGMFSIKTISLLP